MPAPFDDLKPFPGDARHHNEPPLDARVLIDFDDALRERGLVERVAEIIRSADEAPGTIISPEDAGKAADLVKMARVAAEQVEAERELLNRPLLVAQRSLKAKADGFVAPMKAAVSVVSDKLDEYVAANDVPALGDYGAKATARETWDFKVVDYAKLPVAIRRHPTVLEAIDKVIRAQVRGGARQIAGVHIFAATKAVVR